MQLNPPSGLDWSRWTLIILRSASRILSAKELWFAQHHQPCEQAREIKPASYDVNSRADFESECLKVICVSLELDHHVKELSGRTVPYQIIESRDKINTFPGMPGSNCCQLTNRITITPRLLTRSKEPGGNESTDQFRRSCPRLLRTQYCHSHQPQRTNAEWTGAY
ncbi:hypothetical protein N657DRAFT_10372 [Parathielavia appendiculata]|uniref:Uncharacterized protein n=1 Tax=Parathielavia appendiculata TaxID=2587402 RepID=A0AAN6U8C0_9PEZI|nr:hypothetical protein N657DRAFT_10372 [Parathielavia appendiculata]